MSTNKFFFFTCVTVFYNSVNYLRSAMFSFENEYSLSTCLGSQMMNFRVF